MSAEISNFCDSCLSFYNQVTQSRMPPTYNEVISWFHFKDEQSRQHSGGEENAFSVIGENGRKFKKDSRVWLHKSSDKFQVGRQVQKPSGMSSATAVGNDDVAVEENPLEALSKITICNDPACQKSKESFVRHLTSQMPDNAGKEDTYYLNMSTEENKHREQQVLDSTLKGTSRKRKWRKARVRSTASPSAPVKDDDFVFLTRSPGMECLHEMYDSDHYPLDSVSSESILIALLDQDVLDESDESDNQWRGFEVPSGNSNMRGIHLSSDGSPNTIGPEDMSHDQEMTMQYSYDVHPGDDLAVTPLGSPWQPSSCEDQSEDDMEI